MRRFRPKRFKRRFRPKRVSRRGRAGRVRAQRIGYRW